MYVLDTLGCHIFMAELKTSKVSAFFESAETNSLILDRRELTVLYYNTHL